MATTFAQQINSLAQVSGAALKAERDKRGALGDLTTEDKTTLVAAINEVKKGAASSADKVSYTQYGYATVEEALDDVLYKKIEITSFTNTVGVVEMGSTVDAVTLNWATNKVPSTLTLDGTAVDVASKTKALTGLGLKASKTWTLVAADERSATATKTTSVTFQNGVFFGVSTVNTEDGVTNDLILSFTKNLAGTRTRTFTVNSGSGQYIYYVYPSRLGKASFNVGGFDGGFVLFKTMQVTNASGYAEEFYIYKSENHNLGNTTVTVK